MTQIARGLADIAITETRLSRVDGEAGRLLIGGFAVEELAPNACFEETLFLLWNDRLPSPAELSALRAGLAERRALAPATLALLRAAADAGTAPMDALRMGAATLGLAEPGLHRTELQARPAGEVRQTALRLVAALPVVAAAYHRLCQGREPVVPDPALDHAASYLHLLTGEVPAPGQARALATYLNTTADHGMNASTFTARVVASTRSCLSSAIVAALGALKGPLHGGAPGPALDMVFDLQRRADATGRSLESVTEQWVRDQVAKGERIMGFGHRVYRVRDPRADVLGAAVERLFPERDDDGLYRRARTVEQGVLDVLAELKPDRVLQTNVEFYTALLLHGLGLPSPLFTPTFAVARVAGWTAHVLEQIDEDRLIRPRVVYAGAEGRRWAGAA
ncbi:MAG: citrate/2-methylcitrate synthase [Myxococcota bacterium]